MAEEARAAAPTGSDRLGPVRRSMCAGILGLQTIALVPVASLLLPTTDLSTWSALTIGIGLPVLCLVGAATMRGRAGGVVGWLAGAATVLAGFATPWLFGLGVVFMGLYAGCWTLGARIDRERAAAIAAFEAEQAGDTGGTGDTGDTGAEAPADGGREPLG